MARSEPDPDAEVVDGTYEGGDLGIVSDDVQDIGGGSFQPAPGVETVCVFPKNPSKGLHLSFYSFLMLWVSIWFLGNLICICLFPFPVVAAGEESELLVGLKNDGSALVSVLSTITLFFLQKSGWIFVCF